ncbi:DUF4259 domain-containing protein [Micrococcus sp.]|uniref:DUF4259 domain-containing protein n=1 Tax=Micrococcus sp. TaxID=1271 RepID=UPI0026DCCDBE|nr:DUF4259 domain-containing protein [Micrococcus sp.]MDO4239697.1 DUF4259 domain-containing protein [Micrococcus sp.]
MSAWGIHVFENDDAQDLVDQILDGTFRLDERRGTFRSEEDGYIDAASGAELIALGAVVRVAQDAESPAAAALHEIAGTDELDLADFLAQFTDEDLATLRELIGVTVHDPAASELYGLWNEAGEREEWARVSQDEGLPD